MQEEKCSLSKKGGVSGRVERRGIGICCHRAGRGLPKKGDRYVLS